MRNQPFRGIDQLKDSLQQYHFGEHFRVLAFANCLQDAYHT